MVLPKLTPEEKQRALKKAQEMRSRRSQIRKQLKSGQLTLAEVLANTDDEAILRMRVSYLLESLPKIGKVSTRKIMEDIGINESRRVQGLGERQRNALMEKLG